MEDSKVSGNAEEPPEPEGIPIHFINAAKDGKIWSAFDKTMIETVRW